MRADATMASNGGLVANGNATYLVVEDDGAWYCQALNGANVRFGPFGSAIEAAHGMVTGDSTHMGPIPREPSLNV